MVAAGPFGCGEILAAAEWKTLDPRKKSTRRLDGQR